VTKLVLEGIVRPKDDDGGLAQIAELDLDPDADEGFFVRLQSWSGAKNHPIMDLLRDKRVRVTIEIVED